MEQLTLTLEELNQEEQEIRNNLGGIVKNFVRTGWSLSRIDRARAYKLKGFRSIADYGRETFGMSPDGVSRFIRVYEKYSLPGDTPELREEYREYNFSQLVEMLQLPESDHVMIRPEVKREDIRELTRFNKENGPGKLLNWQQDPDEILKEAAEAFFRERKNDLNQLYEKYGISPYTEDETKEMAMFLYHGKSKRFRNEKIFIILYPDQIFVKGSDGEPRDITWPEFFKAMGSVFDGDAGDDTWKNHFEPEDHCLIFISTATATPPIPHTGWRGRKISCAICSSSLHACSPAPGITSSNSIKSNVCTSTFPTRERTSYTRRAGG